MEKGGAIGLVGSNVPAIIRDVGCDVGVWRSFDPGDGEFEFVKIKRPPTR
jgi:hypothetical protein